MSKARSSDTSESRPSTKTPPANSKASRSTSVHRPCVRQGHRPPELQACLEYVREGDELVVHWMDRLARSLPDLRHIVDELIARGITVTFVKEHLSFTNDDADPCSVLMLSVMGAVAEFERSMMLERQREGIALAKRRGVYRGRKPSLTPEQAAAVAHGWVLASRRQRSRASTASAGRPSTTRGAVSMQCRHYRGDPQHARPGGGGALRRTEGHRGPLGSRGRSARTPWCPAPGRPQRPMVDGLC